MAGRPQRSRKQIAEQRETRVRLSSPREAAHFVEVVRGYGFPAYAEGARAIAFAPREELRWALLATRGLTMREPLARDPGKVIPLFRRKRSRGPKRAPGTSAASPAFRALRREAQALGVRAEASADSGSSFQAARLHQETADAYRRLSDAYRKAGYEEDSNNAHFTSVGYATSAQHYLARLRETGRDVRRASGRRDPQRLTPQQRKFISKKIRILRHEGRPQAQSIAIAYSMAGASRRKTRRTRRDASLESIYALVDRAKDPASRAVLHDALLERYPAVYKSYIRLAEHPKGQAQLVGRGRRVAVVTGGAYGGRRLVLFHPGALIDAERRFREPAKRGRRPTAENANYWISEAFDVVSEKVSRPRGSIVVYTSKRTTPNRLREAIAALGESDEFNRIALLNPELVALEQELRPSLDTRDRELLRRNRDTDRDAPRTYPIAPGFRLALRPFPFGAPGRELEWVVTKQDRPNLVFASGEAADVADARRQALRRIPGTATTRTSLRRLVGASSRRI